MFDRERQGSPVQPKRVNSTRPRTTSEHGRATRQRLLAVAIRVFAARRFEGARAQGIAVPVAAKGRGHSRSALCRQFP